VADMKYSGSFAVSAPAERVVAFVRDLEKVAPCIPDVVSYTVNGDEARVKFRVELGEEVPIAELRRVTADSQLKVTPTEAGAKYSMKGRAAGSGVEVSLDLSVKPGDAGSTVQWVAEVSLGRLFGMMAKFVDIDAMVKRIAQDTIDGIVKCMGSQGPT